MGRGSNASPALVLRHFPRPRELPGSGSPYPYLSHCPNRVSRLARRLLPWEVRSALYSPPTESSSMHQRLLATLVIYALGGAAVSRSLAAQSLSPAELAAVEEWFRRTSARAAGGEWGVAIGTMDGRVLWSV